MTAMTPAHERCRACKTPCRSGCRWALVPVALLGMACGRLDGVAAAAVYLGAVMRCWMRCRA